MSKQKPYHPIFYECTGKNTTRYVKNMPWVCDGWLYATDDAILVRQVCDDKNTPQKRGGRVFPQAARFFGGTFNTRLTKIPPLDGHEDSGAILLRTGYAIQCKYLRLLVKHGARLDLPKKNFHPARFTIDGGIEGRIMPTDSGDAR